MIDRIIIPYIDLHIMIAVFAVNFKEIVFGYIIEECDTND